MIKLTLIAGGKPLQRTFFQRVVILGAEESSGVDFPLPLPLGQHESVTLIDEGTHITLTNLTFDQLVQIDGRAVVSQSIQSGQTIDIGGVVIAFEGVPECAEEGGLHQTELAGAHPFELDLELLEGGLTEEQIDRWIRELEGDDPVVHHSPPPSPKLKPPRGGLPKKIGRALSVAGGAMSKQGLLGAALLLVIASLTTASFLAIRTTNREAMRSASQELADLAMALVHAQLTGESPPVIEALAPSFLAPHLATLLPDRREATQLRSHQLKLYSTRDFSRFLLVADPNTSSFWRRLAPLPLLVVSSDELILRKGHERDALRHLLGWSRLLDGINRCEIDLLLNRMEPIPLQLLDRDVSEEGWAPPMGIEPASAVYLASAPRFHRLSALVSQNGVAPSQLLAIPGLVLYGPDESASTEWATDHLVGCHGHCSIGQISLDKATGRLTGARYLGEIALTPKSLTVEEPVGRSLAAHVRSEVEQLAAHRLTLLQPIAHQVVNLVESHLNRPSSSLPLTLGLLTEELLARDEKIRTDLERSIADLQLICAVNDSTEATLALADSLQRSGLDQISVDEPLLNEARDFAQLQEGVSHWIGLGRLPLDLLSRYVAQQVDRMLDEAEEGRRQIASADLERIEGIVRLFGCQADKSWFELVVRCDQIVAERSIPQQPAPLVEEEGPPVEELSLPPPLPVPQMPHKQPRRSFFRRR